MSEKAEVRVKTLVRTRKRLRKIAIGAPAVAYLMVAAVLWGCDDASDLLAPYEAERPLILQRVTQSSTADIQWLGGRVAAIGINRGDEAALDSSLIWIRRADDNTIDSHVTVGDGGDEQFVRDLGGEPVDVLENGETYTVWLATTGALDAGLDSTQVDQHTFVDTTVTMELVMLGRSGGDPSYDFEATIRRDERLTGTDLVLTWEPQDLTFRQIAIRQSSTGGFTDLVWHAVVPEDQPPSISSPVVIGQVPEGAQQAVEFTGFERSTYTLWMVTDEWTQEFGPRAEGYVFFTILESNFEQEEEPSEEGGEEEAAN